MEVWKWFWQFQKQVHGNIFQTHEQISIFFLTHDISGTYFLGAQTNIAVSKLLWLQPWGTVLHTKLHPVKLCGNADIRFLVCHVTTWLKGPISGRLPPTLICYFDTSGGYRYCKSVYSRFSFFLWPVDQRIMKLGGQGYVTTLCHHHT